MSDLQCHREDEVLDALGRGFIGAELREHLDECSTCGELHQLAGALLEDRVVAVKEAAVPSAGTMWWRMQMRQRHDAQAAARRSLFIGQALTLTIALALVGAFFGTDLIAGVKSAVHAVRVSTPLLVLVGSWLLLAPIAGWVAIRQK